MNCNYSTIGANFKTTAKYINDPVSEYYVPDAVPTMTISQLEENKQKLADQIETWNASYQGANKKSRLNLDKILAVQTAKLDAYNNLIAIKGDQEDNNQGIVPIEPKPLPGETEAQEMPTKGLSSYLPWILGGAAIIYFITRKK